MMQSTRMAALLFFFLLSRALFGCTEIRPPGQGGAGPGDNSYICNEDSGLFVEHTAAWIEYMGKDLGGYIYAPACPERPEQAAIVFFFHMFIAEDPAHYEAFFSHLAGKGYIVVAPNYNTPGTSGNLLHAFNEVGIENRDRGVAGAKAGLLHYMSDVVPMFDVPVPMFEEGELIYGVVGNSYGGPIGLGLANPTVRNSLPGAEDFDWNPKVIVMMATGKGGDLFPRCPGAFEQAWCCPSCPLGLLMDLFGWVDNGYLEPNWMPDPDKCPYGEYVAGQHCMVTDGTFLCGDLSDITYNPLFIVMSGEDDTDVVETPSLQGYCTATNIVDKQYIRVRSDDHGHPLTNDLIANHTAALGADLLPLLYLGEVDALDYWGYWKIVTAAMDCAIHGQDCSYARGGTDNQLSMGNWSDGKPVKRMQWNPDMRDNDGICYPLEEACDMVNDIDPATFESAWNWRGGGIPADCAE